MRILFTFTGGSGHFIPAAPIARAAVARGHQVAFSAQEAMLGEIDRAGFTGLVSGGRTLVAPGTRAPLMPVDRAHEERVIRDSFAGRTARERAGRLLAIGAAWGPDIIVRDEVDFGAAVAAERLGIPHAAIIVLAAGGLIRPDLVAEPLDALRAEHGLPADPYALMLNRYLTLVPVPPSYRVPDDPLPSTAHHIRPAVLDPPTTATGDSSPMASAISWLGRQPDRPVVYFSLGTIFNQESGDLFPRVVAALSGLAVNVLLTVGREVQPSEMGTLPENVYVEQFIPYELVLPHCDVIVSHAGSGSVVGALAFGLPMVLFPMGADQPLNGDRCQILGFARVLDPMTVSPEEIRGAMEDVLHRGSFKRAAKKMRDEILGLPTPEYAVGLIEDLLAHR